MAGNRKTNRYNNGIGTQRRAAAALDDFAEFDSFKAEILPKLRQFIKEGRPAEEIYAWSQSYMAAQAISIGISSTDEKVRLAAIKEVLDRGVGKAAENVNITSRYESLSDEELESLLRSQEEDIKEAH